MTKAPSKKTAGMSDAAVQKRTGKAWSEWFSILERAGAKSKSHQEIVAYLEANHAELGGWWHQMLTVGYEQGTGRRAKHEKPDGYQISRSKTVPVSAAAVFDAWHDAKARARWLKEKGLVMRKATPHKCIRITWHDAVTSVEVSFYAKGAAKTQVTVQHNKLPNASSAEKMKVYWGEALTRLQQHLQNAN